MRDLVILFVHVLAIFARLLGPGGLRSVVAESVLAGQQLLILNRSRQKQNPGHPLFTTWLQNKPGRWLFVLIPDLSL
jgi:hypothetical protein